VSGNSLKNIRVFSEFSAGELDDLLASAQKRAYPRGSIVLHEGDVGDMLYFIRKGRVKVVLIHREGREVILNILKPGDCFGEMAVFDHMPRSATIMTELVKNGVIGQRKNCIIIYESLAQGN
jgi:CRP/FNR family cyclic AMP-dependent transcriptional regulator